MEIYNKLERLKSTLEDMEEIAVAYSGGVDSTLLLALAGQVLGDGVVAVTVDSAFIPREELALALEFARARGMRHMVVSLDPLRLEGVADNSVDRCYVCKKHIFSAIKKAASDCGIDVVADGSNADDRNDYRPGLKALEELGVVSPLKDAGLTKEEIRFLARDMGLAVWDKPSAACLASRFPYGTELTREKLAMVEEAEKFLHGQGFRQVRVRCHNDIARIEVSKNEMHKFLDAGTADRVNGELKEMGFRFVTLDLEGYRTGSMNQGVEGIG